jgi:hypothetical protein
MEHYFIAALHFFQQINSPVALSEINAFFIIVLQKLLYFDHLNRLTTSKFEFLLHDQTVVNSHFKHHHTVLKEHEDDAIAKILEPLDPHFLTESCHEVRVVELGKSQVVTER